MFLNTQMYDNMPFYLFISACEGHCAFTSMFATVSGSNYIMSHRFDNRHIEPIAIMNLVHFKHRLASCSCQVHSDLTLRLGMELHPQISLGPLIFSSSSAIITGNVEPCHVPWSGNLLTLPPQPQVCVKPEQVASPRSCHKSWQWVW